MCLSDWRRLREIGEEGGAQSGHAKGLLVTNVSALGAREAVVTWEGEPAGDDRGISCGGCIVHDPHRNLRLPLAFDGIAQNGIVEFENVANLCPSLGKFTLESSLCLGHRAVTEGSAGGSQVA